MKLLPCVRACVCVPVCVHLSHFQIIPYISFIYEDISTIFTENGYACKKFGAHFKNNMADCLKVIDMF